MDRDRREKLTKCRVVPRMRIFCHSVSLSVVYLIASQIHTVFGAREVLLACFLPNLIARYLGKF